MSYGGGYRLEAESATERQMATWREDAREFMEEMNQFDAEREVDMRAQEEERNALALTYARFERLQEQGVHEIVPEAAPDREAAEEEPSVEQRATPSDLPPWALPASDDEAVRSPTKRPHPAPPRERQLSRARARRARLSAGAAGLSGRAPRRGCAAR